MCEETMTFIQAHDRYRQIQESGKAIYLKSQNGIFNQIAMPDMIEHGAPLHWVYLIRTDGQPLHVRLRNEQIVYIK